MLQALRHFAFRHRRLLAALYLALLGLLGGGLWAYVKWVPDDVDTGITIAARAWFHRRTFAEVAAARDEFAAGKRDPAQLDAAEARLLQLFKDHPSVQPAQLWTQALTDASRLLADVYVQKKRGVRAVKVLDERLAELPLDYQLWWAKGRVLAGEQDHAEAAVALREAFKLSLHHPGVLADYVLALNELARNQEVVWAADQFERALVRGAPHVVIKVGIPRSPLERKVLTAVGITVEQGRFFRHDERFGLPRGPGNVLELPAAMFTPWPWPDELVVQLRFENVYEGVTIDAVTIRRRDGTVTTDAKPPAGYLHREGSGVGAYAELFTGVAGRDVESVAVTWSCAEPRLSAVTLRSIEKARRNVAEQRGG